MHPRQWSTIAEGLLGGREGERALRNTINKIFEMKSLRILWNNVGDNPPITLHSLSYA